MESTNILTYQTSGGLGVERWSELVPSEQPVEALIDALDSHAGALFTSTFEYPGRYTRWTMGFIDPALEVRSRGRKIEITAHNSRGKILLQAINESLIPLKADLLESLETQENSTTLAVIEPTENFIEEERSRQPSVFSVLRAIISLFQSGDDSFLGLYGSFGYDLTFQFDPIKFRHPRDEDQADMVLFVPDEIFIIDHKQEMASVYRYDFTWKGQSTKDQPREQAQPVPFVTRPDIPRSGDHQPGEYSEVVHKAKESFARGDLFEVVAGQVFTEGTTAAPSEVFRRLRKRNPAPYGALINLGKGEFLVSASPEMYVRVEGKRVETCPIAGTTPRGNNAIADAEQILELLNSVKNESELTMCTDVDRNDKSRVCEPDSIKVIGRRQIEMYSRLIHTVDHVEGTLLPHLDGLDAFLAHTWAVTVTGAPKLWAMRFIEEHEKSARRWYGGAIGVLNFNGNINTGLTLRTLHIRDGIAYMRAGATLLMDSDPDEEEMETRVKASALLDALRNSDADLAGSTQHASKTGEGLRVLLIDHEDSFVHTLAGYLRRTGADVTTVRVPLNSKISATTFDEIQPDLVVLSPGPGRPEDFNLSVTLTLAEERDISVFGVCLGLQGIVEYLGGDLDQLSYPSHGKASEVTVLGGSIFEDLPQHFKVGRYHSLYARKATLPSLLTVTAETADGLIMAVEHKEKPITAVQFHPESIMTLKGETGMQIVDNVMRMTKSRQTDSQ